LVGENGCKGSIMASDSISVLLQYWGFGEVLDEFVRL
jgi:hypothetical protein